MAATSPAHLSNHRRVDAITCAVAALAGLVAGFSPASPTGHGAADWVLLVIGVGVASLAAATTPWWLTLTAAGVALAAASAPLPALIALVGLVAASLVGIRPDAPSWLATAAAGLALVALAWSQLGWFFGASAIVGIAVGVVLLLAGIVRLGKRPRRAAIAVTIGLGVAAALATAGFAMGALDARDDLANGKRAAERAIRHLDAGEFEAAQEQFERSAGLLRSAEGSLGGPAGTAAAWVPLLAQHRDAALTLSRSGAAAAATAADALDSVHAERLTVTDGRIDLAAVTALSTPFHELSDSLHELRDVTEDSRSPWLIAPLQEAIDELLEYVDDNRPRLDNAVAAVDLAPQLLGANEPRVYLVLFTTPAEARGLGGFIGNYAELTIVEGHFELTETGRVHDLEDTLVAGGARISGPDGFIDRYGGFGFDTDGNGLLGTASWRNLTIAPNFPWVGDVAAEMYSQAAGTDIDGVIAMDPYTLQALTRYTGPIHLPSLNRTIDQSNAAPFLLRGQYEATDDRGRRIEALDEAAEETMRLLLSGHLPQPAELARDLGPLAAERRLLMWSADAAEQRLLHDVGLSGEIPAPDGADGWSVAVTNAGGSKIDTFLQRSADYAAETDPVTGVTTGTISVELYNAAPAQGLPHYVIGNSVGLPRGTSRLYVVVYSPLELVDASVGGERVALRGGVEMGWNAYETYVDIGPGEQTVIEVIVAGATDDPDEVVTWEQPLVREEP